jgi:hypothetical protein
MGSRKENWLEILVMSLSSKLSGRMDARRDPRKP